MDGGWLYICVTAGLIWGVLFYPRYDLEVTMDGSWEDSEIIATDFYSLRNCRREAHDSRARYYVCLKKTGWGQMFNKYSKYDSKHD